MAVHVRDRHAWGLAIGDTFLRAALGAWLGRLVNAVRREDPTSDCR